MIRRLLLSGAYLLAAVFLVGCNWTAPEQQADEAKSTEVVELLRSGNLSALEQQMDASLRDRATASTLAKMQALFPDDPPTSQKTVSYRWLRSGSQFDSEVVTEYGFSDNTWIVTDVRIRRADATAITGFHATALTQSLEQTNRFTFVGKPAWNDCMLVLTLGCGGLVLYAFALCVKTRLRKKWLWLLLTLVGVSQISFNWTTSKVEYRVFWIAIPAVSVSHVDYSPWYLFAGIPLGAVIFLAKRKDLQLQAEAVSTSLEN